MPINLPVENAPYLDVSGLEIASVSDASLSVAAGRARNSTNESDIILAAGVTVDTDSNGINALDTGSLGNNLLYKLYAVGDSSQNNTPGAQLSLATSSAPTLPVGYDMYRLIGYLRTDGTADLLAGFWSGSANERLFMYDAPLASPITAGASTSDAEVALDTLVPAVLGLPVVVNYAMTPAAASRSLTLKPYGAVGAVFQATSQVTAVILRGSAVVQAGLNSALPSLEYLWSAGGGDAVALDVAGYHYSI